MVRLEMIRPQIGMEDCCLALSPTNSGRYSGIKSVELYLEQTGVLKQEK